MVDHRGGIGNAARQNIRALRAIVGRHRTISFPSATYGHSSMLPAIHGRNYLHFNPCSRDIGELAGNEWFTNGLNIGFWAWETTEAPKAWLTYDPHMSQIWVPSHFVKTALEDTGFKAPIHVIPHAIEPQDEHAFSQEDQPITFLVQFDGHSRIQRKRPDLSIRAITRAALTMKERVRIIVKCHHDDASSLPIAEYPGVEIEVISRWLKADEMAALWSSVDAIVSLNRGEGFGLPMVEAMARGMAVIATNWGGSTDYLRDSNSYPVRISELECVEYAGDAYFKTGHWATPSLQHAEEQVQRAIQDIRSGAIAGKAARAREMAATFSFQAMIEKMKTALATLQCSQ